MSKEMEIAIQAAQEAGKILVAGWDTTLDVVSKEDNSLVTQVDKQSEDQIIQILKESFPTHSFLGEEGGSQGSSEYCWYIDPIDGTTNYSRRIPICVVSIALAKNSKMVLGVIFNPFTNELFTAEAGQGTYLNGKRVTSSAVAELGKAVIAVSYSHDSSIRERVASIKTLITKNRSKRDYGSIAYQLALLASGRLDACFNYGHKDWDCAAGSILVAEAGGVVTDLLGKAWELGEAGMVSAGNKTLHQEFLDSVKNF